MHRLWLLPFLALAQHCAFASVYKCEQDGKVAYQASPCTNGSDISRKLNLPAPPVASASSPAQKERRCTGKELEISFRDMPIRMTLAVLQDIAKGHNLIVKIENGSIFASKR